MSVGLARCTTLSSKAMGINDAGFLGVLEVETENKQRAGQGTAKQFNNRPLKSIHILEYIFGPVSMIDDPRPRPIYAATL